MERLDRSLERGQPVVLVFLHMGPLSALTHWLRARGVPAATLILRPVRDRPAYRGYLDAVSGRAGGLTEQAAVFDMKQLRRARKHLRAGRPLLVAADGLHGRYHTLDGGGFGFEMSTGMLRLASGTGAAVIPCLITAEAGMGFTVHFGEPAPPGLVADPAGHRAACEHLLREFLKVIRRHPAQCSYALISRFRPAADPGPGDAVPPHDQVGCVLETKVYS
jgi:lauroyl/myristoyl acyltransferase